jgi:hypothetical protein
MISKWIRSTTVCSFSALALISTANASDFGNYGAAPPSLDFPTGSLGSSDSDLRKEAQLDVKKNSWVQEEHLFLSSVDPFPSKDVAPYDPISKQKVARVLVGPAYKTRGVTFYNISKRKERIYDLPVQRAECYDKSDLFSSYTYSSTYSASVTASASFEGLGLSASMTKSRTFTTGREISASGGVVADYTPYAIKQDWSGRTFIQQYNSKNGAMKFLDKPTKESPWWVFVFWPMAAKEKYPMDFRVKDADWTFVVDREILETCAGASKLNFAAF